MTTPTITPHTHAIISDLIQTLYAPEASEEFRLIPEYDTYLITDYGGTEQPISLHGLRQLQASCLTSTHLLLSDGRLISVRDYQCDPLPYQRALRQTLLRDPHTCQQINTLIQASDHLPPVHVRGAWD